MIPKALGCPRCQAAVDTQDKFCQQCGLLLEEPRAHLTCPHCCSAYDHKGNLCQSCGRFLVAVNLQVKNVSRRQPLSECMAVPPAAQGAAGSGSVSPAALQFQASPVVHPSQVLAGPAFVPAAPTVAFVPVAPPPFWMQGQQFASVDPSGNGVAFMAQAGALPVAQLAQGSVWAPAVSAAAGQSVPASIPPCDPSMIPAAPLMRSLPQDLLEQKLIESANRFLEQESAEIPCCQPASGAPPASLLADSGAQALESLPAVTKQPAPGLGADTSEGSDSPAFLYSPLLNPRSMPQLLTDLSGISESGAGSTQAESFMRPLFDLSLGLLMVAYAGALIFWLADQSKAAEAAADSRATSSAQAAICANRQDEAVAIMDKLAVGKSVSLVGEERKTLDAALLAGGKSNFGKQKYRLAMVDLWRVSPGSAGYGEAREILAECLRQTAEPSSGQVPVRHGASGATASDDRIVTKTPTSASTPPAAPAASRPTPEFSDADVTQYNSLLANYFTRQQESIAGNGELGSRSPVEKGEPPSLREWVEQGKPTF